MPLGPLGDEPRGRSGEERDAARPRVPPRAASEIIRLTRGASMSARVSTPSSATGSIAAAASANQITPRTACTAPTNVTARTSELVARQPAPAAAHREQRRRRRSRAARTGRSSRPGLPTATRGGSVRTGRRRASGRSTRSASSRRARRARVTGARIASASGSHESLRARTSSITPRSTVRAAPRTTEPWRFAHTTSSGRTRSVRRRIPRRDASTRSHSTPAKSGSAVVCARIVQPHGPARIASRPTRKVERDEAPPVRAVGGGESEREEDEEDAEQDHRAHPGERVRAVEDDLGEPLLVGPRLAPAEDRDRLRVREAVLTTSRPAISVSHVSPTTIEGAKTERSTIPTSETSRIGKGLVSRARRSGRSRRLARGLRPRGACPPCRSDAPGGSRGSVPSDVRR